MRDTAALSVEQGCSRAKTERRDRTLYWLLGICAFPALNVAFLWWLEVSVWTFHTMAWGGPMIAWFATLSLLLALESVALLQLRRRVGEVTLITALSGLALLIAMGLVWLVGAQIVQAFVIASHIPPD